MLIIIILIGFKGKQGLSPEKIGFILPVTGDAALYGEAAQNAGRLAIADLAREGINISPLYEDSQLSGTVAASLVQKFISAGDVGAVISFGSGDALAMCPIIKNKNILLFNSGSSPKITDCEHTFRNYPSDIYQGKILADKATELGYKKVALVYLNNDYGAGLKKEFLRNYPAPVIIEEQAPGAKDFRTQLIKIKASGAEQIILISQLAEAVPFLNEYLELGLNMPILASESIKDDSLPALIPRSVQKKMLVFSAAEYQGSEAFAFKKSYEERYGSKPPAFADYVYDNTIVAGRAIDACGSKSQSDMNCLENFVKKYKGTGATGAISFGSDGDIIGKSYDAFTIEGGKFVRSDK